jgi:hypothetical protein
MQCDQIGPNVGIFAALGYFLLNQFSAKQALFTNGLL